MPSMLAIKIALGQKDWELLRIIDEIERLPNVQPGERHTLNEAYIRLDMLTNPRRWK